MSIIKSIIIKKDLKDRGYIICPEDEDGNFIPFFIGNDYPEKAVELFDNIFNKNKDNWL